MPFAFNFSDQMRSDEVQSRFRLSVFGQDSKKACDGDLRQLTGFVLLIGDMTENNDEIDSIFDHT